MKEITLIIDCLYTRIKNFYSYELKILLYQIFYKLNINLLKMKITNILNSLFF